MNSNFPVTITVIEEALKRFPFLLGDSFSFTVENFEINHVKIPNLVDFEVAKGDRNSDKLKSLKNKNLESIFRYLEYNKEKPSVYVYWLKPDSINIQRTVDNYQNYFLKKDASKTCPSLNNENVKQSIDKLIVYVGKSERNIDGRTLVHLGLAGNKYPKSLKLKENVVGKLQLSIIQFDIKNNSSFWKKILPFSFEYFLASSLKPILGSHR